MLDPCLLPQVEMTDGVLESAWFLTIDGDGQEHNTTLDWIGTASYRWLLVLAMGPARPAGAVRAPVAL